MKKQHPSNSSPEGQNTAGWLTTFNDLVTLLMVFFVLLFTMGSINVKKMSDFQYALQSGLGILKEGQRSAITVKQDKLIPDMSHVKTQAEGGTIHNPEQSIQSTIENAIRELGTDIGIRVTYMQKGARVSFEDCILFDFGRAEINPAGFAFLDRLAGSIRKLPYSIRVEGHTDNVPIHTRRFPSNWELSIARAVNVVKYFADTCKIDPRRLSAVGYGESKPVAPNDSADHRTKNRRVEIVLIKEDHS
jgi:chemotaxis protein MotB